jgi:membrane-associated phospholipid phosphatase
VTILVVIALVVAAGLVAYFVMSVVAKRSAPLDTEKEERWFVLHAPPPLRRFLYFADRRVVGGAALAFIFTVALVAATFIGWVFDTIDENRGFARWDKSAAQFGADHASSTSTRVLEAVTQFGATGWLLLVMAVIGGFQAWRHRKFTVLLYLAAVGIGVSLLNNGLKLLVHRERPAVLQLTSPSGYSFPSGHTAAAAACWAAIAVVVARKWPRPGRRAAAVVALVITLVVGASRVLLGVHWLTDVIAGAIFGWTWFVLVTVLFGGRILRFGEPAERIAEHKVTPAAEDRQEVETPA